MCAAPWRELHFENLVEDLGRGRREEGVAEERQDEGGGGGSGVGGGRRSRCCAFFFCISAPLGGPLVTTAGPLEIFVRMRPGRGPPVKQPLENADQTSYVTLASGRREKATGIFATTFRAQGPSRTDLSRKNSPEDNVDSSSRHFLKTLPDIVVLFLGRG